MSESEQLKTKGSSITRVLDILDTLAKSPYPLSPADLSSVLNIPKPSIHRLLQTLDAEGFVQLDITGGYIVGNKVHQMLLNVWKNSPLKTSVNALLVKLSNTIGETCGIAVMNNNEMIYTDRVQTNWPLQIYLPVGSKVPLWCTSSGKLFLSYLPHDYQNRILKSLNLDKLTQNTITRLDVLSDNLKHIYKANISTDNEEFIAGMVAVSVPILNKDKELIACLYTHAPTIRKSIEDLLSFQDQLHQTANEISQTIQAIQERKANL